MGETAANAQAEQTAEQPVPSNIRDALQRYWGFDSLRPLQREAIEAGLERRDSLLVMPTGGGKSLCYQLPPIVADRMDIVISPLIALMKDQVDGLRQNGYPAAALHSQLGSAELSRLREEVRAGTLRLLFITPERLLTQRFLSFVERQNIRSFTIDEAHCISQWGHDFRKEYRGLRLLKQRFPDAAVHACTATATPRVQDDIIEQLGLVNPRRLVGVFDRPNLVFRIIPAMDRDRQILQIIRRHAGEAAIVYCIARKETERLAEFLRINGVRASAYHAGLERIERTNVQDEFAREEIDVVVATVAFGMGIDRSNVRCVIHAAMPKSVEHYQQETGRAGRDGLEAECVMLYSFGDAMKWERLLTISAEKADDPAEVIEAQLDLLSHMTGLCTTLECRHRALSRYFGQRYDPDNCGACDVCLGEIEALADSTTIAQKILSCVVRVGQCYGVKYTVDVLRGAKTQQVRQRGHDSLSTYGLLKAMPAETVSDLVYQLLDQGLLERSPVPGSDLQVLAINEDSTAVLRGQRDVLLSDPQRGVVHKTEVAEQAWVAVDKDLFDELRRLRKSVADERGVPAFVIFSDATLRAMAKHRPTTLASMGAISGVGRQKLADLGNVFVDVIRNYCDGNDVESDVDIVVTIPRSSASRQNPLKNKAMKMLADGVGIDDVAVATGRAESTIWGYLAEFVEDQQPDSIRPWVSEEQEQRVRTAAAGMDADRLRPIYEALGEEIPYDVIRVVLAWGATRAAVEAE